MLNNADVGSERAVIAGICKYGSDAYVDVADIVTANSFTIDTNQMLYKCLQFLLDEKANSSIDLASIFSAAHSLGFSKFFEKEDERKVIRAILNLSVNKENIRKLAAKIRKLEITRLLSGQLDDGKMSLLSVTGDESLDHILGLVETPIFDFTSLLAETKSGGPESIGAGIDKYIDYLATNQREMVGISTGYPKFDAAIGGGLRERTVNMIGARPKMGKTTLADNIAYHIGGILKVPVLNLDTEMAKEDHWNRILANISGIEINDIETGKFAKNAVLKKKIDAAAKTLRDMKYDYISIAGQPFEETLAMMRRWVVKTVGFEDNGKCKPCVIIYDYLKLMSQEGLSKNLQEYQLLGFQMTGLHNFMVRYGGTRSVSFIQLNRDGINKEDTDVASGSDRLVWLCSNFSIFKKKSPEEIAEDMPLSKDNYNRKIIPVVCRHGAGMDDGDYINMKMHGSLARISEGKTRSEVHEGQLEINKDEKPIDF